MFTKGGPLISNNIGYHFFKLTGDDIALVYCGILISILIASIGSTKIFIISISGLLALALLTYVICILHSPRNKRSSTGYVGGYSQRESRTSILACDYFLVFLVAGLQTVDMVRKEDAIPSPFRMCMIAATYMFILTGIRRKFLIFVWLVSTVFQLTLVQRNLWTNRLWYQGSQAFDIALKAFVCVFHLLEGLLLYDLIYLLGTELLRLRLRPRIILQDLPHIVTLEISVFNQFYHKFNLVPPIDLSPYDHLMLLHHLNTQQVLSRLHVRQRRLLSRLQADFTRKALSVSDLKGSSNALSPDVDDADPNQVKERIKDLRMKERMWSISLKLSPAEFMMQGYLGHGTNKSKTTKPLNSCDNWQSLPWNSKEAIICEASIPARYVEFRRSTWTGFSDVKLERWFLAWQMVALVRLLTIGRKVLMCYLVLCFICCIGALSELAYSIVRSGFRTYLAMALYIFRVVSYLGAAGALIKSTSYTLAKRRMDWVRLTQCQILKYRCFGVYILLSSILDWALIAEQLPHYRFVHRASPLLQQLAILPFILAVPPPVFGVLVLFTLLVMVCLCARWPTAAGTFEFDMTLACAGCVACLFFVSVPLYKVLRALFGTYAAPYLIYMEALRPLCQPTNMASEEMLSVLFPNKINTLFPAPSRSKTDEQSIS